MYIVAAISKCQFKFGYYSLIIILEVVHHFQDCNNFQAGGDIIRSSVKTDRLDETAVFGAVCKHEYPKLFCNIKQGGERLVLRLVYAALTYRSHAQ